MDLTNNSGFSAFFEMGWGRPFLEIEVGKRSSAREPCSLCALHASVVFPMTASGSCPNAGNSLAPEQRKRP
jgi:hypothetical protein